MLFDRNVTVSFPHADAFDRGSWYQAFTDKIGIRNTPMAISTIKSSESPNLRESRQNVEPGCLVVHTVGDHAGLLRIDLHLADFATADVVRNSVQLLIPGEISGLPPSDVVGDRADFVVSFFSAHIANSGELPGEAMIQWESVDRQSYTYPASVVSAEDATQENSALKVQNSPEPSVTMYPTNVIVYSVVAIFIGLILGVIAFVM